MVDVNNEYTVNIVTGSSMSYLKTIEIDVDGVEPEPEVTTSIAISGQTTSFDNGATFDKGSLVVLATSSLGVISDVTDLADVTFESGVLDSNNKFTVTDQIVEATVKYGDFTKTYDVTVGTVQTAISTDTALVFTNKNYIDTVTNKIDFGVVAGSKGGFTVSGKYFGNPSYLEFKIDDKIEFNLEVPTGKKAILTVSYYYNKEGVVTLDAKPITGNFNSTSGENNLYDYELKTSGSVVLAATADQNYLNYIVVKFVDSEYTVKFNANGGKFDTADYVDVKTVSGIVTAPTTDPTKDNSTFKGWFTSTDGGTTLSDTAFDFATEIDNNDLVLYAKWEAAQSQSNHTVYDTPAAKNKNVDVSLDSNFELKFIGENATVVTNAVNTTESIVKSKGITVKALKAATIKIYIYATDSNGKQEVSGKKLNVTSNTKTLSGDDYVIGNVITEFVYDIAEGETVTIDNGSTRSALYKVIAIY